MKYRLSIVVKLIQYIIKIDFQKKILSTENGKFYFRNFMDLWTIIEVCVNQDYKKIGLSLLKKHTVIDVGAAIGEFSILASNYCKKVYAIEPLELSATLLAKNIKLNKRENIQIITAAIGSKEQKMKIPNYNYGGTASSTANGTPVKTIDFSTLLSKVSSANLILKIDCEGAEYDIILNTPKSVISKFSQIAMEWHEFEKEHNHLKLVNRLRLYGFNVKSYPNQVHSNIGFIYATKS